jgi:hypothetical protein
MDDESGREMSDGGYLLKKMIEHLFVLVFFFIFFFGLPFPLAGGWLSSLDWCRLLRGSFGSGFRGSLGSGFR